MTEVTSRTWYWRFSMRRCRRIQVCGSRTGAWLAVGDTGKVGRLAAGLAGGHPGAGDPDGMHGVRETDAAWGDDCGGLDGPGCAAAVTAIAGPVTDENLRPWQAFELLEKGLSGCLSPARADELGGR
ncbi:hypothetical protein [Actinoplanes philippinensis]|uniref:hypothetical protein n=1 Tax=Actinoplanes philippinensis TaxID=35752 RepID=UPI001EF2CB1C|nr:hypothetical protein [Actinoplanes philippinensis]